ncbi:hypothetical protein [Micromonospora sp. C95]|uniref:hypothetical protein n=1 Tax=Micromonospora sp. C95 TaxID=2824882 RepID=UPI001B372596|nr:hypothetical protein [Micromonospora sp. C95]MBQ1027864.1 hypothetical protein [Micromonospora sp. C95]
MSDLSGEFNDLSLTDLRQRRGSAPAVDYDVEAQQPLPSRSYTQPAPFFGDQPLEPIQEGVMYDSPPSPTGSNDSTSSISLYDVPGADVVAQADDGSLLAKFGERTFYWLQSAGMVTSFVGAVQGAFPATASAASYVQGAGGIMTVVGGLYKTFDDARKAMERGRIDTQTGLPAAKVHRFRDALSKPGVQLVANLATAGGGVVSASAALAAGRTDIAFAGTLISAAATALNSMNAGREDPGKTGKHFLIEHRAEITRLDSWTAVPRDLQKALTKFYKSHDKNVERARAAAVQSQASGSRPSVGRSSSVSHPSGGGYGYQQNPQAAWGPGAGQGQGSGSQQRKGRR